MASRPSPFQVGRRGGRLASFFKKSPPALCPQKRRSELFCNFANNLIKLTYNLVYLAFADDEGGDDRERIAKRTK
jgi:hypothetical protein